MAPLRLHPDTLYRDDLDAAGAPRRAAPDRGRGQALPAAARPAAPRPRRRPSRPAPVPPAPVAPAPVPPAPVAAPRAAPSFEAFRTRPAPIAIAAERMVVAWSPKSACSHVALWTFLHEGLAAEAAAYHEWPHEYRMHVYYKTARFRRLAQDVAAGGGRGYTLLKVTRDPAKRLVSMFRHACRFPFMAEIFRERLGIDIATAGISLRDFAAALEGLPLVAPTSTDPHICAQYHPVWDWDFDRVITLNIDQIELDAALNAVEAEFGMEQTDFAAHAAFGRCARRIMRCRRGSTSPARSRTTASRSARSAASRAGSSWPRR